MATADVFQVTIKTRNGLTPEQDAEAEEKLWELAYALEDKFRKQENAINRRLTP